MIKRSDYDINVIYISLDFFLSTIVDVSQLFLVISILFSFSFRYSKIYPKTSLSHILFKFNPYLQIVRYGLSSLLVLTFCFNYIVDRVHIICRISIV